MGFTLDLAFPLSTEANHNMLTLSSLCQVSNILSNLRMCECVLEISAMAEGNELDFQSTGPVADSRQRRY